jgi:hypothetical protein
MSACCSNHTGTVSKYEAGGGRSEAAFLHKAAELGFGLAKPWETANGTTFIIDNGGRFALR